MTSGCGDAEAIKEMTKTKENAEICARGFIDTVPLRDSLLRRKLQDLALVPVRHHIELTIRAFVHGPDSAIEIGQEPLLADHALVLQNQSHESAARERRDEEITLPCRKKFPGVERNTCGRDVRRPEVHGLLHSLLRRLVAVDGLTSVFVAVSNRRKSVVLAFDNRVDFIAAARSVLACPQFAGARMDRHALVVAAPDGRAPRIS